MDKLELKYCVDLMLMNAGAYRQIGLAASTPFVKWDEMSSSERSSLEARAEQLDREATKIKLAHNLEPKYSRPPARIIADRRKMEFCATSGHVLFRPVA